MNSDNPRSGPEPKVARLIDEYGLSDVGDELEAKWTRRENRYSLRQLADTFNRYLVTTALGEAGIETITEDISHIYEVLHGIEGSSGQQTQLKRRLDRQGVDVKSLIDDFVTYQAIRSYLTKYRGASLPTKDDEEVRETEVETVEQLRARTEAVIESKLDRLEIADRLQIGPHRVYADVRVLCESCGRQYEFGELLEAGSCKCYDA